tara:strand:+ start:200 stop:520 length:321 start_codon:yes stop_codon:yes gene_type:complete
MTDLNDIMMQARQMQENFQEAQKEMEKLTVDGESGAGLVKVRMNGKHDVVSVVLDDSLFEEDKPVIEDLIGAAVNDAVRKLEEQSQQSLGGLAQNFKMPDGFKFPF